MKRILLVAAGIILVAVVAVVLVIVFTRSSGNGEQPPALQASAGVYRLSPAPAGLPELPAHVSTPAGLRYLSYGAVVDGGRAAQVWVGTRPGDPHPVQVTLSAGETRTTSGLQLRVVHIWSMPDPSHDAIDIYAVGAS
ncbi:MAG TPA: hypothetical protein VHF26_15515 [Trebonia sp.]|nr:hypothetical protein [Trebonia sp.]